jgi:CheY-like chemotaxis protein
MNTENAKILLAEDNPVIADVLRFNLEHAGFSVTVAADGRQATERLESEQFDAIITDYQMPHVSGEELCRNARQNECHKDVPIFLCSAKGLELDTNRLTEDLRIAKVFFKPFSPREVVQAVRATIQQGNVAV